MANSKNPNKKTNTEAAVRELIAPIADRLGYALWDVRFVKEGTEHYLRITIDKADGIQIDDCEKMSRAVDPVLDEHDPVPDRYYLEISSVGLDRPLKTEKDFLRFMNKTVEVRLYKAQDGVKEFSGELCAYTDGMFTVQCSDGTRRIVNVRDASLVRPYVDFNEFS